MEHTKGDIEALDYAGYVEIQAAPAFYGEPNLLNADDVGHEKAVANGNRMVLAWNAHDDMLEALENGLESYESVLRNNCAQWGTEPKLIDGYIEKNETITQMRAAIAKAKGETN